MMDYRNRSGYGVKHACAGNMMQTGRKACRTDADCRCASANENTVADQVPVMVYIVQQQWENVYPPCRALAQGTLFPALDKPFFGKGGCCND